MNSHTGRSEYKTDEISAVLVRRMAATLGKPVPPPGAALPPLWHWMFFQPEVNASALGRDGHPAAGDFLPPLLGRNRMWAGGELEFIHPLIVGEQAQCLSTLESVTEKQGRSGALMFITVRHEYRQHGETALIERQNIVYREASPPKTTAEAAPSGQWQQRLIPDATLLFRYSAVTFNGHRIHYDYPYVTDTEGYANLVVHGPLLATLALEGFQAAHPDKTLRRFSYRGVRPAILPAAFEIGGRLSSANSAEVWITNEHGLIQHGEISFA